jgi:hypothetical protein
MPGKKGAFVVVRPRYEVELYGGRDTARFEVGTMLQLHPASDLWMRGAKEAELRSVVEAGDGTITLRVRPYMQWKPLPGPLHTITPRDILIKWGGTDEQAFDHATHSATVARVAHQRLMKGESDLYVWFIPGGLLVGSEKPVPEAQLAFAERIPSHLTVDQLVVWFANRTGRVPYLGGEK